MNSLLFAALLSTAYPPAPPPPEKPMGAPPQILVASVDQGKLIVTRTVQVPKVEERIINVQEGQNTVQKKVTVTVMMSVPQQIAHDLSGVKAFDGAGKEIDAKILAERLKKPTPVVVSSDGQPVDARYLELLKADAVVLVGDALKAPNPGPRLPPERIPPLPPQPLPPQKLPGVKETAKVTEADEPKKEEPKGKEVKFDVHAGHFEKNNSGLKGDTSFLVIPDAKAFADVFGVARTMGPKPNFVNDDTFDKKVIIATIQRGMKMVTYKVDKVTDDDGTLTIAYTTTSKDSNAMFHSPLIVSVEKGKYKNVVFLENGKKVGTADFPK